MQYDRLNLCYCLTQQKAEISFSSLDPSRFVGVKVLCCVGVLNLALFKQLILQEVNTFIAIAD